LSADGNAAITVGDGDTVTLTNTANIISGAGEIAGAAGTLTLINQASGVINANAASPLVIDTATHAVNNPGTLEATAGGELFITGDVVNAGSIKALSGAVAIAGDLTGKGTATITGTGTLEIGGTSATGVTFGAAATGELTLDTSTAFTGK